MRQIHSQVVLDELPGAIILTRYNDIKTTGLAGNGGDGFVRDTRGGGDTFHDLGQLVVYPILRLKPLLELLEIKFGSPIGYSKFLEYWIGKAVQSFGFELGNGPDREIGIWIRDEDSDLKVGFIGSQVKRGATMHGFAVNLNSNLDGFKGFDPCGLSDVKIGNLKIDMDVFANRILEIGLPLVEKTESD